MSRPTTQHRPEGVAGDSPGEPREDAPTRLASGIAHQLNNLLTVINGHASILLETIPPDHPGRPSVEALLDAGTTGVRLTDQLHAYAGHRPRGVAIHAPSELLEEARPTLVAATPPGIDVTVRCPEGLSPILVDPARFQEICLHIAAYAAARLEGAGHLVLTAEAGSALGDAVLMRVVITGPSLCEIDARGLFEPYAPAAGVSKVDGLRLASVWGLVRQCGGAASAVSDPESLTLELLLPAAG